MAARRVLGTIGVVGAMLATVVLEAAMGAVPRRHAPADGLAAPVLGLLWLAAVLAAGVWWAMPWAAFVGSLLVQTHFSYVYRRAAVAAAAVAAAIGVTRAGRATHGGGRRLRSSRWLLVLCWAQTVWDQMPVPGTSDGSSIVADSDGLGAADGRPPGRRLGARAAVLDAGRHPALPPRRLRSTGRTRSPRSGARSHRRLGTRPRGDSSSLGAATTTALAAMALSVSSPSVRDGCRRPPSGASGGPLPQNYFWMWPIGVFLTTSIAGGLYVTAPTASRRSVDAFR